MDEVVARIVHLRVTPYPTCKMYYKHGLMYLRGTKINGHWDMWNLGWTWVLNGMIAVVSGLGLAGVPCALGGVQGCSWKPRWAMMGSPIRPIRLDGCAHLRRNFERIWPTFPAKNWWDCPSFAKFFGVFAHLPNSFLAGLPTFPVHFLAGFPTFPAYFLVEFAHLPITLLGEIAHAPKHF